MIEILSEYPLVLLFTVASLGYLLGSIRIGGYSLGVAAVLFTGLAFGASNPNFQIPEIILLLGLSVFVYSIGLSSGPAFFESYRKNGLRDFSFAMAMLLLSGAIAVGVWALFGFSASSITGIYSGSTTNTPALAGVIDYMNNHFPASEANTLVEESVVGFSYSYVMGVLGGIIAIVVMEKVLKIDYEKEKESLKNTYPVGGKLRAITVEVTHDDSCGIPLRDLKKKHNWNVVFGRTMQGDKMSLAHWDSTLCKGDLLMVVGDEDELNRVIEILGIRSDSALGYDRSKYDVRRIFVSNPRIAGRTIAELNLNEKFNAIITRIRRGDVDMLAKGNTVLELGDRIRFIAHREDLDALSKYFGDSYQAASKVNLFSFGLGIGLGLILGSIEFQFGSDFSFKLGYAGGPLVVGLLLGALRRTGNIVWTLPYSANVTLQQIGLIFLLTAIGVRSGNAFIESFSSEGLWIFLASSIIALFTAFSILIVGYKFLKMPFSLLMGMVANQPAILDFATDRTQNRIPMVGYAMMFPIALISKIIISQVMFVILY